MRSGSLRLSLLLWQGRRPVGRQHVGDLLQLSEVLEVNDMWVAAKMFETTCAEATKKANGAMIGGIVGGSVGGVQQSLAS